MCLHKAGTVGSGRPRWVAPRLVPVPRTGPILLSPAGGGSWVYAGLGSICNIFGIRKKQTMRTWCRGGMLRSAGWLLGWQPPKERKSVPGGEMELGGSSTSPQTEDR